MSLTPRCDELEGQYVGKPTGAEELTRVYMLARDLEHCLSEELQISATLRLRNRQLEEALVKRQARLDYVTEERDTALERANIAAMNCVNYERWMNEAKDDAKAAADTAIGGVLREQELCEYAGELVAAMGHAKRHLRFSHDYRDMAGDLPDSGAMYGSILAALDVLDAALSKNTAEPINLESGGKDDCRKCQGSGLEGVIGMTPDNCTRCGGTGKESKAVNGVVNPDPRAKCTNCGKSYAVHDSQFNECPVFGQDTFFHPAVHSQGNP